MVQKVPSIDLLCFMYVCMCVISLANFCAKKNAEKIWDIGTIQLEKTWLKCDGI